MDKQMEGFGSIRLTSSQLYSGHKTTLRVRSDGKVKTPLSVLAKGHQTYGGGTTKNIISDVALFNLLTQQRIKNEKTKDTAFVYTQHVLRRRVLERSMVTAPNVPAYVMQRIGDLLTAVLAFKGKTLGVVSKDLKLLHQAYTQRGALENKHKNKMSVTYNVNTTVTWGEVEFTIGRVTVKKTYEDGMFFCSHTCKNVKRLISGALLTKDGQVNNVES